MPENPAQSSAARELTPADRSFIAAAAAYVEQPSFLMRLANLVGKPIEAALGVLPAKANEIISHATNATLDTALSWAIRSLPDRSPLTVGDATEVKRAGPATIESPERPAVNISSTASSESIASLEPAAPAGPTAAENSALPEGHRATTPSPNATPLPGTSKRGKLRRLSLSPRLHTVMAATTGAVGGMFGLAGLALEAPATTTVMLRSIAATAARQGADLNDPLTRLQCLAVLSLGSPAAQEMDSAYLTARLGMALAVRESAQFIAQHNAKEVAAAVGRGSAPSLVRLMSIVAARFQIVLTEKVAAQIVPITGALAGAMINAAFTDHFNTVANYHFGILRLEQSCGAEAVHAAYEDARRRLGAGKGMRH